MKIAVIGRGSAGSLAAAQVSRRFPEYELTHIYNSKIPIIGVGEGTVPGLPEILKSVTGLESEAILNRLKGTRKQGINFENWGKSNREFFHHFHPIGPTHGFHLSADTLVELLEEHTVSTKIDANVSALKSDGLSTVVEFDNRDPQEFDVVFDARGFPKAIDPAEHIEIPFIPTNSAIIRRAPPQVDPMLATRSVARPHGWIFVIPLQIHTSFGYIYNRDLSEQSEVEADFDQFLAEDGTNDAEQRAVIGFPNYISRTIYDGSLARVGNTAGFMEPLEATALALIERQIAVILEKRLGRTGNDNVVQEAAMINRHLISWAWKFGIFISWHYAEGSTFDTPFWRHAQNVAWPSCRSTKIPDIDSDAQMALFNRYLDSSYKHLNGESYEFLFPHTFGGFNVDNFADMAKGLNVRQLRSYREKNLATNIRQGNVAIS